MTKSSSAMPPVQNSTLALRRTIRRQMMRMGLVIAGAGLLIFLVRHFVWEGIVANPYLNSAIIGVFAFGLIASFQRVAAIRKDAIALAALQEAYADARRERIETIDDPYWRHYRAMKPGVVFSRPRAIGPMFDLAYDELFRTRAIRISVATLRGIGDAVESRMAEDRSLISYLTGLLVFLGLIGTFFGLMEMVGSIGQVIAGLNNAESGSADTMRQLLRDLQAPLTGMAMGFSSSLFGLVTSLLLGLVNRFASSAIAAVTKAFETWLSDVAHLEGAKGGDVGDLARLISDHLMGAPVEGGKGGTGATGGGGQAGPVGGISDVGVVATVAQGLSRMNQNMDALAKAMPRLIELQTEQIGIARAMLAGLERMQADTGEMREQSHTLVAGQQQQAEMAQEMINLTRTNESRLTSGFNGMAHIMEVTGQAYLDGLRRLTSENYETNARLAKLLDVKAASDRITEIAGSIEAKVKSGVGSMTGSLEKTALVIETAMQRIAAQQGDLKDLLVARQEGGAGGVPAGFDQTIANGFNDLSRSIETVFASYATLVNRQLVAQAMGADEAGPAPAPTARSGARLPEHEARPQAKPEVDHDEMRRRLYQFVAKQQTTGTAG